MGFDKKETDQLLADCGRRCCICGLLHRVQVHHIKPKEKGGTDDIKNGIPLCPNCHDEVHTEYSSGKTTKIYSEQELKFHRQRTIELVKYGMISGGYIAVSNPPKSVTLTLITVSPTNSSIAYGMTQQFVATAQYSDGTSSVISIEAIWTSVNPCSLDKLRAYSPLPINSILLSDLSPLSPADKLAEARTQFNDIFMLAKQLDVNAIGAMQSISTKFLTLSRQYNASGVAYFTDFSTVKSALLEIGALGFHDVAAVTENAIALACLRAYTNMLILSDLGALSPESKLTEARKQFNDIVKRTKLGDTGAFWQIDNVSAAFLKASNYYFGGGADYVSDFDKVQQALSEVQSLTTPIATDDIAIVRGLASGVTIGTSIITATSGAISGAAILTTTVP